MIDHRKYACKYPLWCDYVRRELALPIVCHKFNCRYGQTNRRALGGPW